MSMTSGSKDIGITKLQVYFICKNKRCFKLYYMDSWTVVVVINSIHYSSD